MAVQNVGTLLQKGLKKLIFLGYDEEIGVFDSIFNNDQSDSAYEEWTGMVGPGVAEVKAKGEAMTYKDLIVEAPKRILMTTRAVGIRIPFEDIQDDQTGALKRLAEAVGRSHKVAQEVAKANIFNGAFSTWYRTGYDGKALCATDHPLAGEGAYSPATTDITSEPARSETTWSNRLATDADLSYTTLIDMKTLLRRTVTREGDFTNLRPSILLVPPELEEVAWEITKSKERPDTANRATSSMYRYGITIVSSAYLIDTDASFLIADRHDLQYFLRMPLKVKTRDAEGTWDTLTESMLRDGVGYHDPRGVVGTPGA